jgi:hypothetical protein
MHNCRFTDELDPAHFHCARYVGPPIKSNFDKSAVYYKFMDSLGAAVTVMPLAFTWTEEGIESYLILPIWMKNMGGFEALKFEKVTEPIEFDGRLSLEWLANLQPSSFDRFPFEEILPQIFGERRPLCNGTVLPFIFGGKRYLMRVKSSAVEDDEIFWFNLETGSLDIKAAGRESLYSEEVKILKNGSWKDEIKVLRHQLKNYDFNDEGKVLFLICGVPLPLQREFIELLEIDFEIVEVEDEIPEDHLQVQDDEFSDNNCNNFAVLEEVEIISSNLITEILKKLSKRAIFLTSTNSIESSSNILKLEKLAHRFNFQILNFHLPVLGEEERFNILKGGGAVDDEKIKKFKFLLNSLNFCDLLRVKRILKSCQQLEFALNCVKSLETNTFVMTNPVITCFPFYGYEKSLKEIENLIKGPLLNPEAYDRFGLPKSSGFLIHGPSGCGKTSLCLNILTNKEFYQNFTIFHIPTASQLLSKYFGETEANIRKLFEQARERKPSIIFIDQIETLGRKRGLDSSTGSNERYLSTLLNEMDGISGNEGVTILACANDIETLDEALLRPGRLDRHFYLGLPNEIDRRAIIKGMRRDEQVFSDIIVNETDGLTGAEIKLLIKKMS